MKRKIVIIGAGINGLMCAYHLIKKDDVEIKMYDQAEVPNPESASFGKHRLIHPYKYKTKVSAKMKIL